MADGGLPHWRFDFDAFALCVRMRRELLGLSQRAMADEAKVAASAVYRAEAKQTVSAANFLALCGYLDADPLDFLTDPAGKRFAASPDRVSRETSLTAKG